MHNDTDCRRESDMQTNQSNGRGWHFSPEREETSLRPWFIAIVCVVVFVGMCLLASAR
jgi:hypothetical protein